jgi:hypothetical protein
MPDTPLANPKPKQAQQKQKAILGQDGGSKSGRGSAQIQGQPGSPCLISYPSAGLPLVGTVGGGCIVSKTNVRAWVGGALLGAGAVLFFGGVVILAASGFRKTGALTKAAEVAAVVPGGQVAAAGLRAAGSRGYTSGAAATVGAARGQRRKRAAAEERQMRRLGEPRENKGLRPGRGAVRETPAETRRRRAAADDDVPPF